MNIVGIGGSPRLNGNTERLVREILLGAEEAGAQVVYFPLGQMQIGGCTGCYYCMQQGVCMLPDEMQRIYSAVGEADALVFGTPVYMGQMSGQAKIVMDRLIAFMRQDFTSRIKRGVPAVLAVTQGQADIKTFKPYFDNTADTFKFIGFSSVRTIYAGGTLRSDDIAGRPELLAEAHELGRSLALSIKAGTESPK